MVRLVRKILLIIIPYIGVVCGQDLPMRNIDPQLHLYTDITAGYFKRSGTGLKAEYRVDGDTLRFVVLG